MSKHILLDMDGVLVDFNKGACIVHNRLDLYDNIDHWYYYRDWNLNDDQFWEPINRTRSFWLDLEEYDWTNDLIEFIQNCGVDFTISSRPADHHTSYSQKFQWCQNKFGENFNNVMFGYRKHLMANPNTILIDDSDSNYNKFIKAGGNCILFPQKWNNNKHLVDDRLNYVKYELQKFLRQ